MEIDKINDNTILYLKLKSNESPPFAIKSYLAPYEKWKFMRCYF